MALGCRLFHMITYTQGDILQDTSEALVNPVNCVGVMGKGLALRFKEMFPANYKAYQYACAAHLVLPGKLFVYERDLHPRYIINFPTKRHWRDISLLKDIDAGLDMLRNIVIGLNICSIAIPALGCGLGGLDWSDVKPLIHDTFNSFKEVLITVYEPRE